MPRLRNPVLPSVIEPIVTWGEVFRRTPALLIGVAALLITIFGLASLGSLTFGVSGQAARLIFHRQIIALLLGLVGACVFAHIDYRIWRTFRLPLLAATLALLGIVLVIGTPIHGSRSWVILSGLSIQVSEVAKFSFLVFLAGYASRWNRLAHKMQHLLVMLVGAAGFMLLIFFEPDFGTAAIYGLVWVSFVLAIGLNRRQLVLLGFAFSLLAAVLWLFVLVPYQKERIRIFLDPARDPHGSGYNLRQALTALGSGGVFGRGFAQGSQSQLAYLPEAQSDFLFAVVGETFGLVGIALLLGLWGAMLGSMLFLVARMVDEFAAFYGLGLSLLFFWEAAVPIAIVLGFLPVTGLALPLMSAGGTSLVMHLVMLGVFFNILRSSPLRVRDERYTRVVTMNP